MFIARSARRIRIARAAFLLAGVLPCVVLVAWAIQRHSAAHRDAVRREWEQAVGLPITVASVEHPLPGTVRARGCGLATADGTPVLAADTVAVEASATEVRLQFESLDCDPAGAAALAGLASEWLERGARFRRNVVIDVADFAWAVPGPSGHTEHRRIGPVRFECVVQGDTRAVRIVRRDADDGADEVRIVRAAGIGDAGAGDGRMEIEATCTDPLPLPILAAIAAHGPVAGLPLGRAATVRGRLDAARVDGRWTGAASGRVAGVDLASCTAAFPAGASGTMNVEVRSIEWRDGRIAACDLACDAVAGRADRRFLDALVGTLGCRPGAGFLGAAVDRERAFDAAGWEVRIDGRGIELAGSARLGGAVAVADGRPLLEPPAGIVPPERLAWLLAPPGAVYVPSSGAGAWLMSLLPQGGGPVERTSRAGGGADGGGF